MVKKEKGDYDIYVGKEVRLIINDIPFPKPKDGLFVKYNSIHVFLKIEGKDELVPFLLTDIKRIDVK